MRQSTVLVFLVCISSVLATVPVAMNCPDGWKWFKRSRGGWCMKVYVGKMVEDDAEEKCKLDGAVVSGVQNKDEAKWMGSAFSALNDGQDGLIWIGMKRTKACWTGPRSDTCTELSSFYWSDGSTVGVSGFNWKPNEPNNYGGLQACGAIQSQNGLMDDMGCGTLEPSGYVCGKIASF